MIVRGLRGIDVAGAGTTLSVDAGSRRALPTFSPGIWQADAEFNAGDSYEVRFHAPRPRAAELAAATSGARGNQGDALELVLPLLRPQLPVHRGGRPATAVRLDLRPFASTAPPLAHNERRDTSQSGIAALRNSAYWRTWRLARRLKRGAGTPYEFARRVDAYFDQGFRYDEHPGPPAPGTTPLEHFLFESKAGYCQHFSGAMALLLRFGGMPTRVATGFSPGGFRRRQREWVVRDRDAHSWVEAWFDGIGWVTFDPTPAATPARSLIAAIDAPGESGAADAGDDRLGLGPRGARNPSAGARGLDSSPAAGGGTASGGGGVSMLVLAAAGAVLLLGLATVVLWLPVQRDEEVRRPRGRPRRGLAPADRALDCGRPAAPGTTLSDLERRLCDSQDGAAYLASLRAARFGTVRSGPTTAERRAFRRELVGGRGWRGLLRAWWALPPQRR